MVTYNGVNHLAMATHDLDMTIRFWRDLLGMRLIGGFGRKGYKHYFFEISGTDMIAFFEWPDVQKIKLKDHGVPVQGKFAFDHVSIGVESQDDLLELTEKLSSAGFWVSEIVDHGFIYSVYSFDPNHIPLEFSYSVPGFDIRKSPVIMDKDPSSDALEGSEPQNGKWPEYQESFKQDGRLTVYPGEKYFTGTE